MSGLQATAFGNSPAIGISRFRSPRTNTCPTWQLICPSGGFPVHPPREKYSAFPVGQISATSSRHPGPNEGRFAIVTDVGQGCGGRGSARDECTEAYGEVVWS
jgi:hypothetical protein